MSSTSSSSSKTKSLEQTRDQLLQRLSLAHKNIKRSKRASLVDHGESFINMTNEERLHSIIIQHAKGRICRVLRSSVRSSYNRRLQRCLYKLKLHADTLKKIDHNIKNKCFLSWRNVTLSIIHETHCNVLQDTLNESTTVLKRLKTEKHFFLHQQEILENENQLLSIDQYTLNEKINSLIRNNDELLSQQGMLTSKNLDLYDKCATLENVVLEITEKMNNCTVVEATTMTLSRVFLRHSLTRKFQLLQKWYLYKWYNRSKESNRVDNGIRQLFIRWNYRRKQVLFVHWKETMHTLKKERKKIHRLYLRAMINYKSRSFSLWKTNVNQRIQLQIFIINSRMNRMMIIINNYFQQWKGYTSNKIQLNYKLINNWKRINTKRLTYHMNQWKVYTHTNKVTANKLKLYWFKTRKRNLYLCLRTWKLKIMDITSKRKIKMSVYHTGILKINFLCNKLIFKVQKKLFIKWKWNSIRSSVVSY